VKYGKRYVLPDLEKNLKHTKFELNCVYVPHLKRSI
jgi:hypothetical protein